jgi:hypothetical protein
MAKALPSLRPGSTSADGMDATMHGHGGTGFNGLHKRDKRGLPHFFTEEAMFASRQLKTLVSVAPTEHSIGDQGMVVQRWSLRPTDPTEHSIGDQGLLIDTDPRHVGHAPLETLELPGVAGPSGRPSSGQAGAKTKGKKKKAAPAEQPVAVSYATEAQIAADEAAKEERIMYEMRQNLQKLKEYGKEIGFSFDISKKKSQYGRMQGERWHDEELDTWKKQASRMLATPEPREVKKAK